MNRWASDAVWSPDGKYVYAAARLHDTISVFKLNYKNDGYRQLASPQECLDSIVIQNLGAYRLIYIEIYRIVNYGQLIMADISHINVNVFLFQSSYKESILEEEHPGA